MFKLLIGGARSNTRILDRNDNLIWMEITFCGMLGHGIFLTYSNNVWRIREFFESTNNSIVSRMHAEWTVITNYTGTFFFSLRQQLLLNFRNLRNSAFDKPIIMQMANRIRNICIVNCTALHIFLRMTYGNRITECHIAMALNFKNKFCA